MDQEKHMPRSVVLLIALGVAFTPRATAAQSPEPPKLEAGFQVSRQTGERGALSGSPRLTLTLAPRSALEFTADIRQPRTDLSRVRTSGQSVGIHLRQTLLQRGRWQLSGVVGVGGGQVTTHYPGTTIFPPAKFVDAGLAVHVGAAAQYEVAGRLAIRADIRATGSSNGGLRAMVGGVIPIGRRFRADSSRESLMDSQDSINNGLVIGAATGAAVTGALAALYAGLLCESDDCDEFLAGSFLVGAAVGTGVGGILGGVIDSLIPGVKR
jgi:hypothetical protein